MKQKFFVPYETAQALKAAGLKQLAITYHEAVDFLEKNGVHVWSDFASGFWYGIIATDERKSAFYKTNYYTREGALNAAILKALEVVQ